jgi:phosphate uptake regulator
MRGADRITEHFGRMLENGRHIFDAAANAFLGGEPGDVRENLFATDKEINDLERMIRREIIVHCTSHGLSQLPGCLVMMSISKDAERIGDYCKNLFDLAVLQRKEKDDYYTDLEQMKGTISDLLKEAQELYSLQDEDKARDFCRRADALADDCDEKLSDLTSPDPGTTQPALTALAYRYQKRIVAHLSNIVTSIFLPVDQLDYFDEDKETRG